MKLSHNRLSSIFVLDQDQALDFYVGVLGLEVGTDADLGFMRWLTVRVPGDEKEILLEKPGPPAHDPETAAQVRELVTKGAAGGWLAFQVDDVDAKLAAIGADAQVTLGPLSFDDFIPGWRTAWIADPDGNIVEISQGYTDQENPPPFDH